MPSPSIITFQEDFLELCQHIRETGLVAFDTEFVSDAGYRSELGLLQFATRERSVAVDPLEVPSVATWWEIMADDQTTVVVHGGQAEVRFCIQLSGRLPQKLVDIQIAEGLRGRSYPLSYSAIVDRVLGRQVESCQTRTDWLRRPLSPEQIEYALEDVSHVLDVWEAQQHWLQQQGRIEWAEAEFERIVREIQRDEQVAPWERLAGVHKLPRRELAAVQRLAQWREEEAAFRNRPARRILRDDLLIDLAKRRPKTVQQALATRDLNRPEYRKRIDDILAVIDEVNRLPEDRLPRRVRTRREEATSDEQVISKLLALALANRCAELDIAQSLVGTNRDLTELVRSVRFSEADADPKLLQGWRGEVCGELLKNVLDGRISFRVSGKSSATPLVFEDYRES